MRTVLNRNHQERKTEQYENTDELIEETEINNETS